MLRRTVLSALALLSLTSTVFGGVIWSSAGSISGQLTGNVTETTWDSDYQIVSQTDVNLDGGTCGSNVSGPLWGFRFGCDAGATGGSTWLGLDSPRNLDEVSGGVSAQSDLTIFGALFVPGAGSTGIQFDMLYRFMVGGAGSGWGEWATPVLILSGSHVPIAVAVISLGGDPYFETERGFFGGKAIATIERGTPILFSVTYKTEVEGWFGHPSPYIRTDFNLESIKEVQVAGAVPEPASIAITALGLLALAAWKSRRRSCGASHCV